MIKQTPSVQITSVGDNSYGVSSSNFKLVPQGKNKFLLKLRNPHTKNNSANSADAESHPTPSGSGEDTPWDDEDDEGYYSDLREEEMRNNTDDEAPDPSGFRDQRCGSRYSTSIDDLEDVIRALCEEVENERKSHEMTLELLKPFSKFLSSRYTSHKAGASQSRGKIADLKAALKRERRAGSEMQTRLRKNEEKLRTYKESLSAARSEIDSLRTTLNSDDQPHNQSRSHVGSCSQIQEQMTEWSCNPTQFSRRRAQGRACGG